MKEYIRNAAIAFTTGSTAAIIWTFGELALERHVQNEIAKSQPPAIADLYKRGYKRGIKTAIDAYISSNRVFSPPPVDLWKSIGRVENCVFVQQVVEAPRLVVNGGSNAVMSNLMFLDGARLRVPSINIDGGTHFKVSNVHISAISEE